MNSAIIGISAVERRNSGASRIQSLVALLTCVILFAACTVSPNPPTAAPDETSPLPTETIEPTPTEAPSETSIAIAVETRIAELADPTPTEVSPTSTPTPQPIPINTPAPAPDPTPTPIAQSEPQPAPTPGPAATVSPNSVPGGATTVEIGADGKAVSAAVAGIYANSPTVAAFASRDGVEYLFTASGAMLRVYDITTGDFQLVTEFLAEGVILTIAPDLENNLLYLGGDRALGMSTLDVGSPTDVSVLSVISTSDRILGIDRINGYVIVSEQNGLVRSYDFSDPENPRQVADARVAESKEGIHGSVFGTDAADDLLYIAGYYAGLRIWQVGTGGELSELGNLDNAGLHYSVDVEGNYAYVSESVNDTPQHGAAVYDITDPTDIQRVSILDGVALSFGIATANGVAYVNDIGAGVRVFDVADPTAPSTLGVPEISVNKYGTAIAASDSHIAVLHRKGGVDVFSTEPSELPAFRGSIGSPAIYDAVQAAGSVAYVGGEGGTLHVLDISDPANIGLLSEVSILASDLTLVDNVLYVLGLSSYHAFDVSDPSNPVELSQLQLLQSVDGTRGSTQAAAISGSHAYIAQFPHWLSILDISDPSSISEVTVMELGFDSTPQSIDVEDGIVYMGGHDRHLRIVDATDPSTPVELSKIELPGTGFGVDVVANTVFVAAHFGGTLWYDVTNPALPEFLGSAATGMAFDVHFYNNTLHVAKFTNGVSGIDVTNLLAPHVIYQNPSFDTSRGVFAIDQYVYVADGLGGLQILKSPG